MPLLTLYNSNIFGNREIVVEEPGEVITDLYSLETCTTVFSCPMDRFDLVPPLFSSNPLFGYLYMERRRLAIKSGRILIAGEYAGIPGGTTTPIYELVIGVGEEPIETHPSFVDTIAGAPSGPLNGAIFVDFETGRLTTDDDKGVFDKFRPVLSGSKNTLAGVQAYLDAGQVSWRETYMSTARPSDISTVGNIQTPPGPVPFVGAGRNWLHAGITYQQRGIIFSVVDEWRASGRNGWNTLIYS